MINRGQNNLLMTAKSNLDRAAFRAELIATIALALVLLAYVFTS